jgi:hypothetical protein
VNVSDRSDPISERGAGDDVGVNHHRELCVCGGAVICALSIAIFFITLLRRIDSDLDVPTFVVTFVVTIAPPGNRPAKPGQIPQTSY